MNTVKAASIDELLDAKRNYKNTSDDFYARVQINIAKDLSEEIFGKSAWWLSILHFTDALCGVKPLKECTNEEVYQMFEHLGIKVEREEKE